MSEDKDLGMSGISTLVAAGVLMVILLFVFRGHFNIEHGTLASFGSYFGGVLTGVGVLIAGLGYYFQAKIYKREQDDRSKSHNAKLAMNLINNCSNFNEEHDCIIELSSAYSSNQMCGSDGDYLEELIKKIESVDNIISISNEIIEDGLLHDHDKLELLTELNSFIDKTLSNLLPVLIIMLHEDIIFTRKSLSKNLIISEFVKRNENYIKELITQDKDEN